MIRKSVLALAAILTLSSATAVVAQPPAGAEPFPAVNSCDELEEESIEWWNCVDFLYYGWWWFNDPATVDIDALTTHVPVDPSAKPFHLARPHVVFHR
jgi:hypothetical protein